MNDELNRLIDVLNDLEVPYNTSPLEKDDDGADVGSALNIDSVTLIFDETGTYQKLICSDDREIERGDEI